MQARERWSGSKKLVRAIFFSFHFTSLLPALSVVHCRWRSQRHLRDSWTWTVWEGQQEGREKRWGSHWGHWWKWKDNTCELIVVMWPLSVCLSVQPSRGKGDYDRTRTLVCPITVVEWLNIGLWWCCWLVHVDCTPVNVCECVKVKVHVQMKPLCCADTGKSVLISEMSTFQG